MPRVSRSVSQRYANASKNKPKRRGESGRATILPPQIPQAAVELPAGLASPAPLDLSDEPVAVARPTRPVPAATRSFGRGEGRLAARRLVTAPNIDYSYVLTDLRRIAVVSAVLMAVLLVLTFLPGLR